jgi:HNH endonuclease
MTQRKFRYPREFRDWLGRKICGFPRCGRVLPKYRRRWCDDFHMGLAYYHGLTSFAGAVYWRDGGVCAVCGIDCDLLRCWLDECNIADAAIRESAHAELRKRGFNLHLYELWQADHIQPLFQGGSQGMENGRILCQPCHKQVTAQSRKGKVCDETTPAIRTQG